MRVICVSHHSIRHQSFVSPKCMRVRLDNKTCHLDTSLQLGSISIHMLRCISICDASRSVCVHAQVYVHPRYQVADIIQRFTRSNYH